MAGVGGPGAQDTEPPVHLGLPPPLGCGASLAQPQPVLVCGGGDFAGDSLIALGLVLGGGRAFGRGASGSGSATDLLSGF